MMTDESTYTGYAGSWEIGGSPGVSRLSAEGVLHWHAPQGSQSQQGPVSHPTHVPFWKFLHHSSIIHPTQSLSNSSHNPLMPQSPGLQC